MKNINRPCYKHSQNSHHIGSIETSHPRPPLRFYCTSYASLAVISKLLETIYFFLFKRGFLNPKGQSPFYRLFCILKKKGTGNIDSLKHSYNYLLPSIKSVIDFLFYISLKKLSRRCRT